MTSQSRLESLPVELLHEVCSYLLSSHNVLGTNICSYGENRSPGGFDVSRYNSTAPLAVSHLLPGNALRSLGSTSAHLRSVVESYSESLLKLWADIVKIDPPPGNPHQTNSFVSAEYLLTWIHHACVFCGKKQPRRRAILANNLACCADCDDEHWPRKIPLTSAREFYHLTDAHLFNYVDRPSHWPMIRFGPSSAKTTGRVTGTWFLRADMERLADAVHGDWKAHNKEREEKYKPIAQKIYQNKRKHIDEGECPGVDGCRYCMDLRNRDRSAAASWRGRTAATRNATTRSVEYTEIPDDDEDFRVWLEGMRRAAREDPNWEPPVIV